VGFDLNGTSGSYFRASIWTWPSYLRLIAASEVLNHEELRSCSYDNGQKVSAKQATQIAKFIERTPFAQLTARPSEFATAIAEGFGIEIPQSKITPERVKDFCIFLRASDGFRVD
jgi:hypothetical protein